MNKKIIWATFFCGLLWLQYPLCQETTSWKTDSAFKAAEPAVNRKARWLEANPFSETWGDSLRYVLEWGHDVPYVTLGTDAEYEKEVLKLTKGDITGRISSMLLVGYAKYATQPNLKAISKREMAKAGIGSMLAYYKVLQSKKPSFKVPIMEEIKSAIREQRLDDLINEQVDE